MPDRWHSVGSEQWERSRQLFDASLDRRPSRVIRPDCTADAIRLVCDYQSSDRPFTVKSGGHSAAGLSVNDGVPLIDLGLLNTIDVDVDRREATVSPGALMSDLDSSTAEHGLATTGGTVSHTGVVGLVAGGGLGWLMGRFGLACDNVVEADVVMDGSVQTIDERHGNMRDFRGRGTKLGLVSSLTLRLHPIEQSFSCIRMSIDRENALSAYDALSALVPSIPPTIGCAWNISGDKQGTIQTAIEMVAPTSCSDADHWISLLASRVPSSVERVTRPYVGVQRMLDKDFPFGSRSYRRSACLDRVPNIWMEAFYARLQQPSPFSRSMTIEVLHGAALDNRTAANSCFERRAMIALLVCRWDEAETDQDAIVEGRSLYSAMVASLGDTKVGSYGNYSSEATDSSNPTGSQAELGRIPSEAS